MRKIKLSFVLIVTILVKVECKENTNKCVLLADSCTRDKNCCNAGFCCEKSTNSTTDERHCKAKNLCCNEGYNCVEVNADGYSSKILSVVAAICFLLTFVTVVRCCYLAKTTEMISNNVGKRY